MRCKRGVAKHSARSYGRLPVRKGTGVRVCPEGLACRFAMNQDTERRMPHGEQATAVTHRYTLITL